MMRTSYGTLCTLLLRQGHSVELEFLEIARREIHFDSASFMFAFQ